jgi:hypothetical protein
MFGLLLIDIKECRTFNVILWATHINLGTRMPLSPIGWKKKTKERNLEIFFEGQPRKETPINM